MKTATKDVSEDRLPNADMRSVQKDSSATDSKRKGKRTRITKNVAELVPKVNSNTSVAPGTLPESVTLINE